MKNSIIYSTILLSLCFSTKVNAQLLDISNYSTADYLGKSAFYGMAQDSNLVIYFASEAGILTYNGLDFTQLPINRKIDNQAIKAVFYYNKSLLFQDSENIYRFFIEEDSLVKLVNKNVKELQLINNSLYFITNTELYSFNLESNSINNVYQDSPDLLQAFSITDQNITIGTKEGLYRIKNGKLFNRYGSFIDVKSIREINDSTQLILGENGVFRYNQNTILRSVDLNNEVAENFFYSDLGNIWITTNRNKVYQFDGIFLNSINSSNGLRPFKINNIQKDAEGNIWIMGENGLSKVNQNQPFLQLAQSKVKGIFKEENTVLLIKQQEFLQYNLSPTPTIYKFNLREQIKNCSSFYKDGQWFILINNKYLYKWNSKENTAKRTIPGDKFLDFTRLSEGSFLAVTEKGELQVLDENLDIAKPIALEKKVKSIISAKNKTYVVQENNVITTIDSNASLSASSFKLPDSLLTENLRSSSLGLWYFSNEGIRLFKENGQVLDFNFQKDLKNKVIFNIYEDSNFNLWLSLSDAIIKIQLSEKESKLLKGDIKVYDEDDHIAGTYFSDIVELDNEQIWFRNDERITVYNPLMDNPLFVAPGISIKKAQALVYDNFNSPTDTLNLLNNTAELSPKNEIWISPLLISHSPSRNSFIEYRNIKESKEWRKLDEDNRIVLSNLPAGTSTIEIQAVSAAGLRSKVIERISVTVAPPFWQKEWFYATSFLSVVLLGFIGFRTINNFKDTKSKELHEKLDKELEDLERKSHLQILKSERLKQLNELITAQKSELEKKNKQIESQKYELSLTNEQIKKQKDLLEETSSKLKASINYAQRIQNALMSTEVEIKKAIDESFVYFMPRDVVSGDFYWFNKVINEKGEEVLILAAVDCTGHGVPGAIVSVVGINLLNNITKLKKIYEPGEILNELNADIISNLRQNETQVNDGMDMSIVSINTHTRQIQFAGAKNPLMYVENGELIRIRGDKHAIGGQQRGGERDFQTHIIDCSDDIRRSFFLFSDGYQDQFGGEKGFKFLTSNFKDLLVKIYDEPILEQKAILYEAMKNWRGDYPQTDDILIIGFKF